MMKSRTIIVTCVCVLRIKFARSGVYVCGKMFFKNIGKQYLLIILLIVIFLIKFYFDART